MTNIIATINQEIIEPPFPKTFRAVEKAIKNRSRDQWEIGDLLLEECPGDPSQYNDGSYKKIEEFYQFLLTRGYEEFSKETLIIFRNVSRAFPVLMRVSSCSWTVHRVLHTRPELLAEMNSKFSYITAASARGFLNARIKAEQQAQIEAAEAARKELVAAREKEEQLQAQLANTTNPIEIQPLQEQALQIETSVKEAETRYEEIKPKTKTSTIPIIEKDYFLLTEWQTLSFKNKEAVLNRKGAGSLNRQTDASIEWADWSWNPVTGCLHGCPYCYAREIAGRFYGPEIAFNPTIYPSRFGAPVNHNPPNNPSISAKNIFTCSMADLFGRWVPDEWVRKVLSIAAANSKWNFLFLTKFPKRMSEFEIPQNAWMGTTVDMQARVANAERAFEKVKAPIKWLSIEPLIEPLKFNKLELFDWIVIGGASPSRSSNDSPATPEWNPPIEWIVDLHQQARKAGCKIYYKTNCGLSDMTRIREFPGFSPSTPTAPHVFHYLGKLPPKDQIG